MNQNNENKKKNMKKTPWYLFRKKNKQKKYQQSENDVEMIS